jgi:4-amino-4-deoxy-L-arabinose transferase-like glycosyltransferase
MKYRILVLLCFAIIAGAGLFHLTESPAYTPDEGWATQIASNIARVGIDGTQFVPGSYEHVSTVAIGYPLLYVLAAWFKLFGVGIFQARLMMLVYMLAYAVAAYIVARRLFGRNAALASLALLAVFPPFYAIGKSVYGETSVLFFLMLSLLCLGPALHSTVRKNFWLILAGVSAGVCASAKPMAFVLGPILIVAAVIAYRRKLVSWGGMGIVAISAVIPVAIWAFLNFHYPGSFASTSGYYSNPAAITDTTATLWHNLRFLFTTSGALYCLAFVATWIAGLAIRLKRHTIITVEEWVAFMFAGVTLVSFLFHYSDSRYLLPVQLLAMSAFPFSVRTILGTMPKWSDSTKLMITRAIIAVLILIGAYQLAFSSYVAQSYASTLSRDMTAYFKAVPPTKVVFFYNAMNAVPLFSGTNFYQRIVMFEKWQNGAAFAPLIKAKVPDMIVVTSFSAADEKVPLTGYELTREFGKMRVFSRKGI